MIRWLRRLGLAIAVAIAAVVVLRVGFGLQIYMDGDFRPHLAFGKPSAHYDALEAQRSAQRAVAADRAARSATPRARRASGAHVSQPAPATRPAARPRFPQPAPDSQPAAPPHRTCAGLAPPDRGPTSAARRATASTASGPSPRPGRPAVRACSGSSRSAKATRRSRSRAASPTRSSSGAQREVVAAYDVATGRELWTHGWDALFSRVDGRRRPAGDADLG